MEKKKYVIIGLYYEVDNFQGKEIYYGKQHFLGVEGPLRYYVFDEHPTYRTLVFNTSKEAKDYIKAHNLKKGMCVEKYEVLTIYPNE